MVRLTFALLLMSLAFSASGQERLPAIPKEKMTVVQKAAAEQYEANRKTPVVGPFVPLLRSPEVFLRTEALGDYLRFKPVLPPKLREFAILVTAREWNQQYEWNFHSAVALEAGLSAKTIAALAKGLRPENMSEEEGIVFDFCTELHHTKAVSDSTYAKALARFQEQGIIDLTSINGYYTFLSMVMNVARTPAPKSDQPALVPIKR